MPKEIYVILEGEYSDTTMLGYCTTEENAEKYCAFKLAGDPANAAYSQAYYVAIPCLDDTAAQVEEIWDTHTWNFEPRISDTGALSWEQSYYTESHDVQHRKPRVNNRLLDKWVHPRIAVTVWCKPGEKDRTAKIAQDALYAYLANQNGVT